MRDSFKGIVPLILLLILGAGYFYLSKSDVNIELSNEVENIDTQDSNGTIDEPNTDELIDTPTNENEQSNDSSIDDNNQIEFQYSTDLLDVTSGDTIRGITTNRAATGVAQSAYINGEYILEATFENLPAPNGTDFYEGWIVAEINGVFDVLSTGNAEKTNDGYVNNFTSPSDLTDHTFYVLTLEPDDGDPEPADHILEGLME